LFVSGQVLASVVLDLAGVLSVPQRPLDAAMVIGATAVVVGITAVVRGHRPVRQTTVVDPRRCLLQGVSGPRSSEVPAAPQVSAPVEPDGAGRGWLALGVLAGAVLPIQGAVNARLKAEVGPPLAVGTISFVVATVSIAVTLLVLVATRRTPAPRLAAVSQMPWWGWLGGLCAATYVVATFLLIPEIGASVAVVLTVTGQQLASALIDHFGWFRMPRRAMTAARTSGLGLMIAGSVLVR
jgi:transporter family-2 protein